MAWSSALGRFLVLCPSVPEEQYLRLVVVENGIVGLEEMLALVG